MSQKAVVAWQRQLVRKEVKSSLYPLLFTLLSGACSYQALAQSNNQLQLPEDIRLTQITTISQTAKELAKLQEIPVNIAIVDARANLKAFLRLNGSYLGSMARDHYIASEAVESIL